MRNSLKVAKWEIKRNMTNKSFIISLFITPVIFMLFMFVPTLFNSSDSAETVNVILLDELHIANQVEEIAAHAELAHWNIERTDLDENAMRSQIADMERSVFIPLTEQAIAEGKVEVYLSSDMDKDFVYQASVLEEPLRQLQLEKLGLTDEQKLIIAKGISIEPVVAEESGAETPDEGAGETEVLKRVIPGAFAGIILFSIITAGMMIFTSASQEKKDKIAEIILSSVTPGDLMQGKIIGYFVLGITQVVVWIAFAAPIAMWRFDLPIIEYLFVPELLLLLVIALAGYLLFSAIFVGMGATVEDMTSTSNFQGMVMMLPFLPFIFVGPIFSDPSGLVAKIGTFIPVTAPGVLLMRLSIMEEWPWLEIVIALIILAISIWIFMKLAGKIFKMGILMYGKNATPKEIWKWLWA